MVYHPPPKWDGNNCPTCHTQLLEHLVDGVLIPGLRSCDTCDQHYDSLSGDYLRPITKESVSTMTRIQHYANVRKVKEFHGRHDKEHDLPFKRHKKRDDR